MHEHAEIEVLRNELHRLQWGAYNREAKRDAEWQVFNDAEMASEEQKLKSTILCMYSELAAEKEKSAHLNSELAAEKWNRLRAEFNECQSELKVLQAERCEGELGVQKQLLADRLDHLVSLAALDDRLARLLAALAVSDD